MGSFSFFQWNQLMSLLSTTFPRYRALRFESWHLLNHHPLLNCLAQLSFLRSLSRSLVLKRMPLWLSRESPAVPEYEPTSGYTGCSHPQCQMYHIWHTRCFRPSPLVRRVARVYHWKSVDGYFHSETRTSPTVNQSRLYSGPIPNQNWLSR